MSSESDTMSTSNANANANDRSLIAENVRRKEKNRQLLAENEALKAQVAERDAMIGELETQVQEFADAIDALDPDTMEAEEAELNELRAWREELGNDPHFGKLAEEIESLRGQIRDGKHKQVFDRKAVELGYNPATLEDVWGLSGYKADGDEVDEPALESTLKTLLQSKPWLGKSAEVSAEPGKGGTPTQAQGATVQTNGKAVPGGTQPLNVQPSQAGAGIGRGSPETGKPLVTVAERVNAMFAATGRSDPSTI